jgi:hypothetical protein
MGWGIAAGWAIVAGSALLTIGTGVQARVNLAEYREVAKGHQAIFYSAGGLLLRLIGLGHVWSDLRESNPEFTSRLMQLARLTVVWTVLMCGSALVLAGAAIQLALAYTG